MVVVYSKFVEEINNDNGGMKAAFILPVHYSLIDGLFLLKAILAMRDHKNSKACFN
jgi:hypothetical protein